MPDADCPTSAEGTVPATPVALGGSGAVVEPVGVLIVDDQAPFRAVARTVASLVKGWDVLGEVESGEDAVATAAELRPDVILMDINLPGISGIEATRRIIEADPHVRVVLLSTYAAADLPADALACGAIAYVRKEDLSPRGLRLVLSG